MAEQRGSRIDIDIAEGLPLASVEPEAAERMFAQFVSDKELSRDELERMRSLLAERLEEEE